MRILGLCFLLLWTDAVVPRKVGNPCGLATPVNGSEWLASKTTSTESEDWAGGMRSRLTAVYVFVDCSLRGLTEVPETLPTNVEFLDLSRNVILNIRRDDFQPYRDLVALYLGMNCVTSILMPTLPRSFKLPLCKTVLHIPEGSFSGLGKLKLLSLTFNNIPTAPKQLPPSLESLELDSTLIDPIHTNYTKTLPALRFLTVAGNCVMARFQTCPRNFTLNSTWPSTLVDLDISMNAWTRIPANLLPGSLRSLAASVNPISKIYNEDFRQASNLEILALSGAFVANYSLVIEEDAFKPLLNLRSLDLSVNGLRFLSPSIFESNSKLEKLYLQDNLLIQLPDDAPFLAPLGSLKFLDISTNIRCASEQNVTTRHLRLSDSFANLAALETLLLGPPSHSDWNCAMYDLELDKETFAPMLQRASKLKEISISNLYVSKLALNTWEDFAHLQRVYAANNQLGRKTSSGRCYATLTRAVSNKKQLKFYPSWSADHRLLRKGLLPTYTSASRCDTAHTVDYSYNSITSLTAQVPLLINIAVLDLSHNNLQHIRENDLKKLKFLCKLDLRYNPVQTVDPLAFKYLNYLQQLIVEQDMSTGTFDLSFLAHSNSSFAFKWKGFGYQVFYTLADLNDDISFPLTSVIALDVSENLIYNIFSSVEERYFNLFPQLQSLSLRKCEIDIFPSNFFSGLYNLTELDLRSNYLKEIPVSTIQNLSSLVRLRMDGNQITSLDMELMSFFPLMKVFTVSNNKIGYVQASFFRQSNHSLRYLDLRNNVIVRLGILHSKEFLSKLNHLDVRWNRLDCSCLQWSAFFLWYTSEKSDQTYLPGFYPKCSSTIDKFFGGCVACKSPVTLYDQSVVGAGFFNRSCEVTSSLIFTVVSSTIVSLVLISSLVFYSRWFKRMLFVKTHKQVRSNWFAHSKPNARETHSYHGFVVYDLCNNQIGDWVDNHLLPAMNDGHPTFQIVVKGRDVSCGAGRAQQTAEYIKSSRKTIVILSEGFQNHPECQFVLKCLEEIEFSERRSKAILLTFSEDNRPVSIPERLKNRRFSNPFAFLQFRRFVDDERLIFEALRTSLMQRNC